MNQIIRQIDHKRTIVQKVVQKEGVEDRQQSILKDEDLTDEELGIVENFVNLCNSKAV